MSKDAKQNALFGTDSYDVPSAKRKDAKEVARLARVRKQHTNEQGGLDLLVVPNGAQGLFDGKDAKEVARSERVRKQHTNEQGGLGLTVVPKGARGLFDAD